MAPRLRSALAALALATVFSTAACSSGDDTSDPGPPDPSGGPSGQVRVGMEDFPESWAPGADNAPGWVRIPYETLVARDPADPTVIEPLLAESWEETDTSLTFHLREGVTFHDGTAFDAAAAKANLDYVRDQAGPFSGPLSVVSSIDAPDPLTVVLNLASPAPSLLTSLTGRGGLMASPAALSDGSILERPVGTGPWAHDPNLSITGSEIGFSLYDGYWDADNVGVAEVVGVAIEDATARLNALSTGEVDLADVSLLLEADAEAAGIELNVYPGLHYGLMLFDRGEGGVFEDVEVRRAFCSGLDPESIIQLGGGTFITPVDQRFSEPGTFGYSDEIAHREFDPDGAREVLEERDIDVELLVFDQNQAFGEAAVGQLAEVGVTVSLRTAPASEYFTTWYSGQYAIGSGENTELTPYEWYSTWFAADAPNNPSGVESPELAAKAEAAIAAGSDPAAADLWAEVMAQIVDEALVCNEAVINQAMGYKADNLTGVETVTWEPSAVLYKQLRLR